MNWMAASVAVGVLAVWSGLLLWAVKMIIDRSYTSIAAQLSQRFEYLQQQFAHIEAANAEEAGQWKRIERELLELKADLPREYVRREDQIRHEAILNSKLDALAGMINRLQEYGE